ncbi:hypothetical protein BGZ52_008954, partial [Haplosporangium bisporale]
MYSAVGKRTNFQSITQFSLFGDQDVEDVLLDLIDVSGCTLPDVKRQKLTGRPRFSVSVVREFFEFYHTDPHTKQTKLEKAFDSVIGLAKTESRDKMRDLLYGDRTGEVVHLLGRMVLAFKLHGGKIWFASKAQVDFINKASCSLRVHGDGAHWLMDEPFVVEVVEKEMKRSNVDPNFSEHLGQLNGIIEHLGVKSTVKGNALEPLAYDTETDLKFLIDGPSNKLLVQQPGTRKDGAWFFSDNRYADSFTIKFYSYAIPPTDHQGNETSSNIRCSFLRADGIRKNPSLKRIRDDYVASGHAASYPVKWDPTTGTEDLMVDIDLSNMDDYFYE